MPLFHLVLRLGQNMVGRQEFEADDTIGALFIGAAIYEGCGEDSDSYEIWENADRVDAPLSMSVRGLTAKRQEHVIKTEESILRGRWAIAKSEHLLARFKALKAPPP